MLNLINILTLSTALTAQPISEKIYIKSGLPNEVYIEVTSKSNLIKTNEENNAYTLLLFNENNNDKQEITYKNYNGTTLVGNTEYNKIAIGYKEENEDITKYKIFNKTQQLYNITIFTETIKDFETIGNYNFEINIRSKTYMEELLTALTTAIQSAVSIFVEGFGGLTQIFYNGTEITFIGGILVVGLAVMFLMMFLRWIVSFVKGI